MKRTCYSAYPVCLICPIYLGVIFFLFLVHTNSFSHTCIDLTKGNMLTAMLHSMAPAHTIINDGEDIVIEKEGSYHILGHSEGAIVVNADNVIIDLNGFTLSGSTSALITVSAENIIIRNGVIEGGCFNTGILFAAGARNVLLQNLYITNCQTGISFEGMVNIPVECCRVLNCYISVCDTAVQMEQACNNIFKNVVACCCQYAGFSLNYSKYNKFQQCKTIGIGTDDKSENVSGFVSLTGLDNLFYECFVENICKKDDANFCTKAAGFRFGYAQEQEGLADVPERESKIINCVVDSIVTTSLGNAYGIYLESKLLAADAITSVTTGLFCESINDIDWSPQGDYIAEACNDGTARVLKFANSINPVLLEVDRVTYEGYAFELLETASAETSVTQEFPRMVLSVAWSPDGKCLAVGTSQHFNITQEIQFDCIETDTNEGPLCNAAWRVMLDPGEPELFVYYFDSCLNKLTLLDAQQVGDEQVAVDFIDTYSFVFSSINDEYFWEFKGREETEKNIIVGGDVTRLVWSNDCKHLYALTAGADTDAVLTVSVVVDIVSQGCVTCIGESSGVEPKEFFQVETVPIVNRAKIFNFKLDNNELHKIQDGAVLADENFSRILAISPDDVYIAYGVRESVGAEDAIFITKTNCGHLVMHPDADTDESIEEIATFTKLNINSFDWNPITCCDNYYFAIGGSVEEINGETKNIELFEFNGTNVQSLGSALLPEQTVTDIKWSSRGKDLVATGTNHAVSIFTLDFSNTDTLIGMLTEYKTINTVLGSGDKYADWTSDGRYFVLAGPSATDQEVPNNIEIFYAGDSVSKCVVQGNNVANICGGLCGIGISGAGRLNLIDKNIVCCSGVKYSQGVFAKYLGGLLGTPGLLDNLPGNDCCACCPCVCREPECVCSCEELKSSWYTVKPISRPISRTATSTKGMSDMRDNKAVIDEIEELRDLLFKDFEFRRFLSR